MVILHMRINDFLHTPLACVLVLVQNSITTCHKHMFSGPTVYSNHSTLWPKIWRLLNTGGKDMPPTMFQSE